MLKFNEALDKMKDEEKNMRMEMTNLVSERDSLKKALKFLEKTQISTNSEKCSLEVKLGKSEGRCKELEKKMVEMEGKVEKLRREKLQLEKKLGSSERKCEDAKHSVEELRRKNEEWKEKTMESDHLEPRINLEVNEEAMDKSATEIEIEEEEEIANLSDFGENADIGSSKKGANYKAMINRGCKLEIVDVIKENLEKENLEIFEQSCFGHFLKINTHQLKFQGQVIFHLMLHIDMGASNNERLVFKINNSDIEFGLDEFSLVTRLDDLGTLEEVTSTSSSIHREVFHGRSSIQLKDIEKAFLNVSRYDEGRGELSLKLAFLYFLYGTLLASTNKKIDTRYLHLIEDLHKFNAFSWGRVAYEFLVSSILVARVRLDGFEVTGKKPTRVCFPVEGFIFALQIWAYEMMPCLATYCASRAKNFEKQTPPILRWHATETFFFNELEKFFKKAAHLGLNGIEASPVKRNRMVESGEQSTDTTPQAATPLSSPEQKKRKLLCEDKDQMPQARDKQSSPTDCYTAEFLEKMDLPGSSGRRMPAINPDLSIPELIELINEIQSTLMEKEKSRRMELGELRVGKMKLDKAAQHYQKRLEDLEATLGEKCDASATDANKEKQNVNADTEDGDAMLSPKSHEFSKKGIRSLAHSGSEPAYTSAVDAHDNEGKEPAAAVHGCSHASVMCSNVEVPRWKMTSGVYHVIVISDSDDEVQDKSKITDYCRVDSKKRSKPGPSTAPSPSPAAADCDSESPLPKFNAATDHVHPAESNDISCSHAYMNLVAGLQIKEKQQKMDV